MRPSRQRSEALTTDMFISWQFGMTLILVLLVAIFLLRRVRQSQERRREPAGAARPTNRAEQTTQGR